MSEEATFKCSVPVYITVDGKRVTKVVIDDQEIDVWTAVLVDPVLGDPRRRSNTLVEAQCVAEDSQDWPAWQFGW